MHMHCKKEFLLAKGKYDKDWGEYKTKLEQTSASATPGAANETAKLQEPTRPKDIDELYDAGSTVGLLR